jgi:hypothetical protein
VWRLESKRAFVGAALLAAACSNGAEAGTCDLDPPGWAVGPPLPTPVYGPASTSAGGYIYSASGGTFPVGGTSTLFQRYNPTTNAWEPLAPVPTAVFGATLAYDAVGQRLFLFGGFTTSPVPVSQVHVYEIANNTWNLNGPSLPSPRANMGSGVIGGLIYLVGGNDTSPGSAAQQTWAFNPGSGTYTVLANLPTPQARSGSAVSAGKLYVISGHNQSGALVNLNYEYTPATNSWVSRAPIPIAVNQPGSTAVGAVTSECNGDIMIVSGGTPTLGGGAEAERSRAADSIQNTQLYSVPPLDSWTQGPLLPTGRFALRAEQVGDTILAFGGYDGVNTVATVDRMQGPPLPVQLQAFSVE